MARIMAHHNNTSQSLSFDILSEESPPSNLRHSTATTTSSLKGDEVLRELSDGQIQSRITSTRSPVSPLGCASPSAKSPSKVSTIPDSGQAKPQTFRRSIRLQRPQADCETFEPLVAVPEESSSIVETSDLDATTPVTAAAVLPTVVPDGAAAVCHGTGSSETADSTPSLQDQVAKHLAATPLTQDSFPSPPMSDSRGAGIPTLVSLAQVPPPPYPGTPLKVPEVVDMVEQAISPYLAVLSEHSSCAVDDKLDDTIFVKADVNQGACRNSPCEVFAEGTPIAEKVRISHIPGKAVGSTIVFIREPSG
ncbi:uncharacterized protein UV8b_01292 [Ustilaginoidea virens]|uniref:Uncharacterized protein n=1 Tax=Ustilaginoidea virens TaxID=1159556 RepID=A0A8E5HKB5_USTVR|nr:uncharacterized protein UV8b_01292 [Ustilaginoidea virens]QUC17051.1 hypothetical protein UV8b_01292 [Ustilaginoidea virens]